MRMRDLEYKDNLVFDDLAKLVEFVNARAQEYIEGSDFCMQLDFENLLAMRASLKPSGLFFLNTALGFRRPFLVK